MAGSRGTQSRNGTADLLKGFAVLFMIQVHLMEQFAAPDLYHSVIGRLSLFLGGPPCAPVFMAVMGYFLASSGKSHGRFLMRGILLFISGIVLNIARSANLLIQVWSGKADVNPLFFIFGVDILSLAGIAIIVTGLLKVILRDKPFVWLAASVLIAAISPYLGNYLPTGSFTDYFFAYITGKSSWSYFPLFPWLSYILLGYFFRLVIKRYPQIPVFFSSYFLQVLIPLLLFFLITARWASGITHNLSGPGGYYHHGLLFYAWMILFLILYLMLAEKIEQVSGNAPFLHWIKWTGKQVTVVYVFQWLIVGNLAVVFYQSQNLMQILFWFVTVTTVSCLLTLAFVRIRSVIRRKD